MDPNGGSINRRISQYALAVAIYGAIPGVKVPRFAPKMHLRRHSDFEFL